MPPTQKSISTRSAHNESDAIGIQDVYYLSDYAFQIQRNSVASSTYDQIAAVCTNKDGKNARQAIQVPSSTKLKSWYVEANETEATVYVTYINSQLDPGVPTPIKYANELVFSNDSMYIKHREANAVRFGNLYYLIANSIPTYTGYSINRSTEEPTDYITENFKNQFTYRGKTVYYSDNKTGYQYHYYSPKEATEGSASSADKGVVAWLITYSDGNLPEEADCTVLVGRFAIDLKDAGGDGPGSDWDDPGDWNEDWEEGDPTQTLHVEVIGALSGRHNDPIEDPSYSYIPADKDTVKDYGCGGDGGNGGGGGAGASTVVIHKFATNQADSKEIVALAKRHGYGSGGGKGGKGGDGCILVYY